jgi:hypothetical protein
MKYGIEMAASGSLQVVEWFKSWKNRHADALRQHGDLIRLASFLEKVNINTWTIPHFDTIFLRHCPFNWSVIF